LLSSVACLVPDLTHHGSSQFVSVVEGHTRRTK
jgi:hypothetical protein